ncbi:MAG: PepSY-associated TM helix domain-containing protein [Pseudomonadota bacterium]|nr:PepSY-associated TM helix domain-containing protein [Pseudomonadota bacterium]
MRASLRQSMAWLHGWSGVLVGWMLYAVFVTGTLSYFRQEISHWMRPELGAAQVHPDAIARALRILEERAASSPRWLVNAPESRQPTLRIGWTITPERGQPDSMLRRFESLELNPLNGEELHGRRTLGGDFFQQFHSELSLSPPDWGRWIVGACAMFMLIAIASGVITHRHIFKNLFTFRLGKGQRSWLDAHNVVGVLALPYHAMITYTGLITLMLMYMPAAVDASYGYDTGEFFAEFLPNPEPAVPTGHPGRLAPIEPLLQEASRRWDGASPVSINIEHPTDAGSRIYMRRSDIGRVSSNPQALIFEGVSGKVVFASPEPGAAMSTHGVLRGLHLANFSPGAMRWLFAFCGLLGTAMVATGVILWSVKRAPSATSKLGRLNYRVLEILNLGTIAGIWLGVAAYFWANRLLPIELEFRSTWEVRCFFIVWALSYVAAAVQQRRLAWPTQFAVGATLFALLPIVNALTTSTHLGHSLPQGLWLYAGFDLAMLMIAVLLGLAAWSSHRSKRSAPPLQATAAEEAPCPS